ncbi:hypothetical protein [Kallipyga massiliensis]|uniref:hypothetical protein n=1 Tax=Kallipyga massiliensis TaxID=1472764 RepID=UPI0004B01B40|nr:hypothetical protein [Kallipyga massiliensis]
MKKLMLSQILIIVFAVLVCISTFLPAAEILGFKVTLIKPDDSVGPGILLIILSALTLAMGLWKKKIPSLIFAGINLALAVYQYSSFGEYMEFAAIGLYLMMIASVLLFAASIYLFIQLPKKAQSGMN